MAKALLKVVSQKKEVPVKVSIKDQRQADLALKAIGIAEGRISAVEEKEAEVIRKCKTFMIEKTEHDRKIVKETVKEMERWASKEGKGWFKGKKKSLDLNFGTVGFRMTPWAIQLLEKAEVVIKRLKAKKLFDCIRSKESVDKEELKSCDPKIIEQVGCELTQKEEFFFEVKKDGVKG